MKTRIISVVTLAAALALTGCSVGTPAAKTDSSPSAASAAPSSEAPKTTPSPSPSKKPSGTGALTVKFGETIAYEDGVKLTTTYTGPATASMTAAPAEARGAEIQTFQFTVENTSAEPFDPAMFYYTAVYGTTGAQAEKVFDTQNGFDGGYFSGLIIPGGKQTVTVAYLIPTAELKTTVFTVQPSFKHNKSIVMGGL